MNANSPRPSPVDYQEMVRLLPVPVDRDLPEGRHHALREYLMNEFHEQNRAGSRQPSMAAGLRQRRKPVLAWAFAFAAVLGLGSILVLTQLTASSPAWAVESGPGDTITVRITEYADAQGLEARLRAEGIRAVVDYIPNGKVCTNAPRKGSSVSALDKLTNRDGHFVFTIDRDQIAPDRTLSILGSTDRDGSMLALSIEFYNGVVEHCVQAGNPL